mmetsp:Transcript_3274/g.7383  ORF Transcript_3274/g.7383 Transcript_3274/m.7383 type:complete len:495 (+) Transcript_3274:29-1513(+)
MMTTISTAKRKLFHLVLVSCWLGYRCHGFSATTASSSSGWKPKIESLEDRKTLRNREDANTETIGSIGFHHVEFYCGDARSMANHFAVSLGMSVTGTTGQATGNDKCVSYGLQSGSNFRLLLTAPYSMARASNADDDDEEYDAPLPMPEFSVEGAHAFFQKHGLAARAIGVEVVDARAAFEASVARGATPVLEPSFLPTCPAQLREGNNANDDGCYIAEIELYGDVVLRYVSYPGGKSGDSGEASSSSPGMTQPFLPHLAPVETSTLREGYGIYRIDHAVGNVHDLQEAYSRILAFTGFHEFAEFTSEDVGTVDSGLNSVVLASDSEEVLLPLNEPTNGRRKSQIQTYLEQNEGPGLQHLALKTKDIFATVRKMRQSQNDLFGFELMKRPSDGYYRELPDRLGDQLTPEQYEELEELGILADSDEEGILLQLFTKPVGDRPTFFFEIIQRIGCVVSYDKTTEFTIERPGCGGFGQGNFRELFKSIEEHEKTLKV